MALMIMIALACPTQGQLSALDQGIARIPLWAEGAPLAVGKEESDIPTITVWKKPESSKQPLAAVVICPGGGYGGLATDHEGKDPAEFLTGLGIQAFILRYRLAQKYQHPAPILDCQRAIRWVRANAKTYNLDSDKIGIWGFSAGGHLASTASTQFTSSNPEAKDPIDRPSSRPNFSILCYPVISMEPPVTHNGSRKNLLGPNPDPELAKSLSNHLRVTANTPPTFIFHTREDKAVIIQNSDLYAESLKKAGVEHEFIIFDKGSHGVGLGGKDPVLSLWHKKLEKWLKSHHFATQ